MTHNSPFGIFNRPKSEFLSIDVLETLYQAFRKAMDGPEFHKGLEITHKGWIYKNFKDADQHFKEVDQEIRRLIQKMKPGAK